MGAGDLRLINARLPLADEARLYELHAADGAWVSVKPQPERYAAGASGSLPIEELQPQHADSRPIDLRGKLLLPGLVEAHAHLDKAFTAAAIGNDSGTLAEAIRRFHAAVPQFTREALVRRIRTAALRSVAAGAMAIRAHVHFPFEHGRETAFLFVEAALEARQSLRDVVDVQYALFVPSRGHTPAMWDAVEEAMRAGMDAIGGAPHMVEAPEAFIERLFAVARKHGKPVDLHADETDDPDVHTVVAIAAQTIRDGYEGQVAVGHLCSLSSMEPERAARTIERMAEARLSAIALPAANLYLQGRHDRGPVRRGVTRVKELLAAGIPVAAASDNVQDPFHPYGNSDLLQIGLLTGYAAHMGGPGDAAALLRMVTSTPAALLGLADYGVRPGLPVRFVVLDAQSPGELFAELPPGRWVYRDRRWLYARRLHEEWDRSVAPDPGI